MASDRILLVQGDTRPAIVCTLLDDSTQNPIDLRNATPRLKVRPAGAKNIIATLLGSVTNGLSGVCVFHPASAPEMLSSFGNFEGEIEVTFNDGQVQSVYETLRFKVRQEF
jgi:hypothetical protein